MSLTDLRKAGTRLPAMEGPIIEQTNTLKYIQRFVTNLRKLGKDNYTTCVLETRLELLENYWKKFEDRHYEILTDEKYEDDDYLKRDLFSVGEESYLVAKTYIKEKLREQFRPPEPREERRDDASVATVAARLPKVTLPKFTGDYLQWEVFRDMFTSVVRDSKALTDVMRLQYLKTHVTGEAAQLLSSIKVTEANYATAWSMLVDRYDNERVLISTHLQNVLSLAPATKESASDLKRLLDGTQESRRAMQTLNCPVEHWDHWFVHLISQKLDTSTRKDWETSLGDQTTFPTFDKLKKFLDGRIRALESTSITAPATKQAAQLKPVSKSRKTSLTTQTGTTEKPRSGSSCAHCRGTHFLSYCQQYKQKSTEQRMGLVKQLRLCQNCLHKGHEVNACTSEKRCMVCDGKHHSTLHTDSLKNCEEVLTNKAENSNSCAAGTFSQTVSLTTRRENAILLATAKLTLESSSGRTLRVRALLDQGSESCFISERVTQNLRLAKTSVNVPVTGLTGKTVSNARCLVNFSLRTKEEPEQRLPCQALVLQKLTGILPSRQLEACSWPHLQGLQLADPTYCEPSPIDLIIGADLYASLLLDGIRRGPPGSPIAQKTKLGWILSGPTTVSHNVNVHSTLSFHASLNESLSNQLRAFWELEEIPEKQHLTADEQRCEDHFQQTHSRDVSGRYTVRLPFRTSDTPNLGESRTIAYHVLKSSERRREKSTTLASNYVNFMTEYLSLGHMCPILEHEYPTSQVACYYMPHHAILQGPSSKTRVVFNASQVTSTGQSLNDQLLSGPKLQNDLLDITMRWRRHAIVISADIVKMFRQIRVHADDVDWQRILWRESPDKEVTDYRLTTVTYGTACAPFLAIRTLRQLSFDEVTRFPSASSILNSDSYVDDILTGADDVETARSLRDELIALLRAGGFELGKWFSNRSELLDDLPADAVSQDPSIAFSEEGQVRALGLIWRPAHDAFGFRVESSREDDSFTKRRVLSTTARLYDPLGWLAPVLIVAKILLQDLWLCKADWDAPLSGNLLNIWKNFLEDLPNLEAIRIPRWIGTNPSQLYCELHGFSDASERAYAAAVYLRVAYDLDSVRTTLLVAKSKVAPVRTVSIPRLELCAATLLAKLLKNVIKSLDQSMHVYAWSDSQVTLAWVRSHPSRWKTFVANRVATIHTLLPEACWKHVPSADNPADLATRGICSSDLRQLSLWWQGPKWLSSHSASWPQERQPTTTLREERKAIVIHVARAEPSWELLERYSSLTKLLRISAYCFRFATLSQNREILAPHKDLSASELQRTLFRWVKLVQGQFYETDIQALVSQQPLSRHSRLLKLNPFIDPEGILRVGGRLQNACLTYGEKHPVILPKESHLSLLLVRNSHALTLHGGPQLTHSHLIRRFWIVGGRNLIRSELHRCIRCARFRVRPGTQLMGQLPAERITPSRPFSSTGLDYAGPFLLHASKGRGRVTYKGYLALFVCLATRAVHLEVVSSYTSEAFLAAYRRFISRRGRCAQLFSDNGTTFRGAEAELRALFRAESEHRQTIYHALADEGTHWSFIPPHAPNFGGLWEAGVKAVKHHLRRIVGETILTYEEFSTVAAQVEACLNSRPIAPLSNDASDLASLTPGHFLTGCALTAIPEPSLVDVPINRLSRWQLTTQMVEHFWRRWSAEYIHTLQQRHKWMRPQRNVEQGDLVIIVNELLPSTRWPLARVIQTHPGDDGLTRVVTLKTATTTLKRPVSKICLLPVSSLHDDVNAGITREESHAAA